MGTDTNKLDTWEPNLRELLPGDHASNAVDARTRRQSHIG